MNGNSKTGFVHINQFIYELEKIISVDKFNYIHNIFYIDMKFITAAKLGEKLSGKVKILKKTKTLIFINCEISNDKDLVVSASGTWKIL